MLTAYAVTFSFAFILFSVFTVTTSKIKMQTIQHRKSWEMKEDKYSKSLAKNQVCAIFHMRDIQKNVVPKFIKLCWRRHAGVPFKGTNTSRTRTLLKSAVRLRANGRNNSQHCCTNSVESCCVYVGSGVQTDVTTHNNVETCSASWEGYNPLGFENEDHFFIFISFPQFIYDLFHISLTLYAFRNRP